jgi:hypothetical protein
VIQEPEEYKEHREDYSDIFAIYVGPLSGRNSLKPEELYQPDDHLCKHGWCHSPKWINIAMGVLMDVSSDNSGVETGKEVAVYLPAAEKTFTKTRIITYSPGISKPIFTDHVLVACCHRIGTYMLNARRHCLNKLTLDRYRTKWGELNRVFNV